MVYDLRIKFSILDLCAFGAEASPAQQCTRDEFNDDPGCQPGVSSNQRERLLNYKEASIYLEVYIV